MADAATTFTGGRRERTFWQRVRWQSGIFGAYFGQFVKTRLAYRMDFLIDTLGVLASASPSSWRC